MLLKKYMREYLDHQRQNDGFYEGYEDDYAWVTRARFLTYCYAFGGATFAAMVFNPNFTKRNSWYLRKFNVVFFGVIAAQWGFRQEAEKNLIFQLKSYDYYPLEVKQALATKDYRYLALYDFQNPNRQEFDSKTKKSLS